MLGFYVGIHAQRIGFVAKFLFLDLVFTFSRLHDDQHDQDFLQRAHGARSSAARAVVAAMAALVSGTSVLVAAEHSYAQSLALTVPRARHNRLALKTLLRRQHPANTTAGLRFMRAVQQPGSAAAGPGSAEDACTAAGYARVERLGQRLTEAAQGLRVGYGVHGQWGIFAPRLQQTKTRFLHEWLCRYIARGRPMATICELGFMAGHSAMLFLETARTAKVVSFDVRTGDLSPLLPPTHNPEPYDTHPNTPT